MTTPQLTAYRIKNRIFKCIKNANHIETVSDIIRAEEHKAHQTKDYGQLQSCLEQLEAQYC